MMQIDENADYGDGNGVDGAVGNGGNGDDGGSGGVGSNQGENKPPLARLDEILRIQGAMLEKLTKMQTETAKGKPYPKWRDLGYWRRKLVVAAPAGIWMLLAGYLGNLLAGYTGIYLYPQK